MADNFDPDAYLAEEFDPDAYLSDMPEQPKKYSKGQAALAGLQEMATLGGRSAIAGLGGAAGSAVGTFQSSTGDLLERVQQALKAGKAGYREAAQEAKQEMQQIAEEQPVATNIGRAGGILLTAPLTAINTVRGAAGLGAASGALRAAGEAESFGDALTDIGTGALFGAGAQRLLQGAGALTSGIKRGLSDSSAKASRAGLMAGKVINKAKDVATKGASTVTGVTEKEIKTFAANSNKVLQQAKNFGDDALAMVDDLRTRWGSNIGLAKNRSYEDLSKAIAKNQSRASTKPIIDTLNQAKSKLNAKLFADDIAQIDDMINTITSLGDDVSVQDLSQLKEYLQQAAKPSYLKQGQIFARGDKATKAAVGAANKARRIFNDTAPEAAKINNQLHLLHKLEDVMNKNVLKVGASPNTVLGAGRGTDSRSARALQKLSDYTQTPMLKEAEIAAAAQTFGKPQLLPVDTTGKSVARMALGAAGGYAAGDVLGLDPKESAILAAAASSPLTLKYAIQGGKIPAKILQKIPGWTGRVTDSFIGKTFELLSRGVPAQAGNIYEVMSGNQ